jgi:hypothetical protein
MRGAYKPARPGPRSGLGRAVQVYMLRIVREDGGGFMLFQDSILT